MPPGKVYVFSCLRNVREFGKCRGGSFPALFRCEAAEAAVTLANAGIPARRCFAKKVDIGTLIKKTT